MTEQQKNDFLKASDIFDQKAAKTMLDDFFPEDPYERDDSSLEVAERLSRRSWRVANLVLHSDVPWIDIELEINQMRQIVEDNCPEKLDLFEKVYVSRFERLREQWREEPDYHW